MVKRPCSTLTALLCGSVPPIVAVFWYPPMGAWDSGFVVHLSDVPSPEEWEASPPESGPICFDCLLCERRGIGHGLDLAREHGAASLVDGEWRADPEAAEA
jgi:hypothetical protein